MLEVGEGKAPTMLLVVIAEEVEEACEVIDMEHKL